MNRSILIVICDFIVLSVLSLSTGVGKFGASKGNLVVHKTKIIEILNQIDEKNAELNKFKHKVKQTDLLLSQLKVKLTDKDSALTEQSQILSKTSGKLSKAEEEILKTKAQSAIIEAALKQKKLELDQTTAGLTQTTKQLNKSQQELNLASSNLKQTKEQLNLAKTDITKAKKQISAKELLLKQKALEAKQQSEQLARQKELMAQRQKMLAEKQKKLEELSENLKKAQQQLQSNKQELTKTKNELSEKENYISEMKGILNTAVTELSQKNQSLKKTEKLLVEKSGELDKTQEKLSFTKEKLTSNKEELDRTQNWLKKVEKELKTDVLKEYSKAVVKLMFDIRERRLLTSYEDNKIWYLPEISLGEKSYIIADFNDLLALGSNWISHRKVYSLNYTVGLPTINSQRTLLKGPILSLFPDRRVCLLPVPPTATPLKPLSFNQLKERGLHHIHLFKKNNFGKSSTNLGNRCSINMAPGDNYLYISNDPHLRTSQINAEPGDVLLTREGRFVGIVVEVKRTESGRGQEAKCFVFPSSIDLAKANRIPLTKPVGSEYYQGFVNAVEKISEEIKK